MKVAADPDKGIYNLFTGGNPYGVPLIYIVNKDDIVRKCIFQNDVITEKSLN